jgi:hypothetical protein
VLCGVSQRDGAMLITDEKLLDTAEVLRPAHDGVKLNLAAHTKGYADRTNEQEIVVPVWRFVHDLRVNVEMDPLALAGAGYADHVTQRLGDTSVPADHFAGVTLVDAQFKRNRILPGPLAHTHSLRTIDHLFDDEFEQFFHRAAIRRSQEARR